MHKDIVFEYPEGVEKLGGSPRCLVQGMYKKGKLISVQAMRQVKCLHLLFHHDGVVIAKAFLRFLLED